MSRCCLVEQEGVMRCTLGAASATRDDRPRAARERPAAVVAIGRDRLILMELARDDAEVTFTGLRRRLGLHPETLTRTLRRLQDDGRVGHEERGYRITEDGHAALHHTGASETDRMEVLRFLLPPDVSPESVVETLAGRWFEGLRWYGRADGPGELVLIWTTEPEGTLVRVRIVGGAALVEVEGAWDEVTGTLSALRGLVAALADLYAPPLAMASQPPA